MDKTRSLCNPDSLNKFAWGKPNIILFSFLKPGNVLVRFYSYEDTGVLFINKLTEEYIFMESSNCSLKCVILHSTALMAAMPIQYTATSRGSMEAKEVTVLLVWSFHNFSFVLAGSG